MSVDINNTVLGHKAALNLTSTCNNNTILGYQSGSGLSTNSTNNVIIGSDTGSGIDKTSNAIIVGNTCKFNKDPSQQILTLISIGSNTLNFNTSNPNSTNFTSNVILGNNIGPRNNNNTNNVDIISSVLLGHNKLAPTSSYGYYINDATIIGDNNTQSLLFCDDLVIIGSDCLANAQSLGSSVFVGAETATSLTSGDYNTVIGSGAAYSLISNNGNTIVGAAADTSGANNTIVGLTASTSTFSNSISIGYGTTATSNNQFIFGSSSAPINNLTWKAASVSNYNLSGSGSPLSINTSTGQIGIATSSRRYKKDIVPLIDSDQHNNLDIMKLTPIVYTPISDNDNNQRQIGFIAEDLDKAGFNCVVNYVPNVKTKVVETKIPRPDKIKIINDKEVSFPQPDEIIHKLVNETDDNGKPIKLNNDYDDVCPDSINYPLLTVLLVKEIQDLRNQVDDLYQKLKDLI